MFYVMIYKRDRIYSAATVHKAASAAEAKAKGLLQVARWNDVLRFIGHYTFIDILKIQGDQEDLVVQYIQNLERQDAKELQSALHVRR